MVHGSVEARLESRSFSCDHLRIHKLSGREAISQLFSFDLEVVSSVADEPVAFEMSGAEVTIVFSCGGEDHRRIHGIITEIDEMFETGVEHRSYRLRVAPRAFLLTLAELQDIFIDQSAPEIVRRKLEGAGFSSDDLELRLLASYPALELAVQYRETDFAFVSRLTEHLGISFFFEHGERRETIVFTDGRGFPKVPGRADIRFRPRGERRGVFCIEGTTRLIPKSYVLEGYSGGAAGGDLIASHESPLGYSGGVVEYGAHFKTLEAGVELAQIRAEEREAGRFVYSGQSDACELGAGLRFALRGHLRLNGTELLVTEVEHALIQPTLIHTAVEGVHYENTFRAIDAGLVYRPRRATPRPRIHGVMRGVVEQEPDAAPGQCARTDERGRYAVKLGSGAGLAGQQSASRPACMIPRCAGPEDGARAPLKPGAEVLVMFIDGDPDRPLIIDAAPGPAASSPVTWDNAPDKGAKTAPGTGVTMGDQE